MYADLVGFTSWLAVRDACGESHTPLPLVVGRFYWLRCEFDAAIAAWRLTRTRRVEV